MSELNRSLRRVDLFEDDIGEQLALTVACPNVHCAAIAGANCQPYTHWIRVQRALRALPRPVERDV